MPVNISRFYKQKLSHKVEKSPIYPEEEGGYTALIPDLPRCMSQGETLEEGIINIEEAVVKKQLLCFLKDK